MELLPNELILSICKQLDFQDKISMMKTCKRFYNLIHEIMISISISNTSYIDESIIKFSNLKHLNLYNSCITKFPTSFKYLERLEYLNVCNTNLETLVNLPNNIVHLDISSNNLKCIPQSVLNLTKLNILECSWNNFNSIECLYNLNLTYLNVAHNNIHAIHILPKHINILDISYNRLTDIHVQESIIDLNISMNNIRGMTGCENIEILNAIGNELKTIPDTRRYIHLYLSSNCIEHLHYFPNLFTLYIDNNPIKFIQYCKDVVKDDEQIFL